MCRQEIDHLSGTLKSARTEAFTLVVGWREVFAVVVSFIVLAWRPVKVELPLCDAVLEPMVSH